MIVYKALKNVAEKEAIKAQLQELFEKTFEQKLSDDDWHHLILTSPYEEPLLVVAFDEHKLVGCSNLIPQKTRTNKGVMDYYLFTTSIVDLDYRSKGVYLELIKTMKAKMKEMKKQFIFAFPNKKAAPIITSSFFGFKKVLELSMMQYDEVPELVPASVNRSILIDRRFLSWRLEGKFYFLTKKDDMTLLCKDFKGELDIIEVFNDDMEEVSVLSECLSYRELGDYKKINISSVRSKSDGEEVSPLIAVMYSEDKSLNELDLDVSLLAWDIV